MEIKHTVIQKYYVAILTIMIVIGCSDSVKVPDSVELNTWEDSVSYSIGFNVGTNFKNSGIEFTNSKFIDGFISTYSSDSSYAYGASLASNLILKDMHVEPTIVLNAFERTFGGDSLQLTEEEISNILTKYNAQIRQEAENRMKKEAQKNKDAGIAFIEDYKANHDDEIVTESGLVYRILKEGYGEKPKEKNRVVVHYTGKLIDGKIFDSSVDRGEPITFAASGVIKGWQEALLLMPVGSKWELVIPSELGYGDRAGGKIPANSTLIFEVELLGIE